MNLILLGAPGAGKGTQAEKICEKFSIPAVSTGNMLREAVREGTEMGLAAKSYMESGKLVPDSVVIGIIRDRLAQPDCAKGFILDGFPRTVAQAEALDESGVVIDCVLNIHVSDERIEARMSGRRVCPDCGASYHVTDKPSAVEGICDKCGAKLIIRKDDAPETVRDRLSVYHAQTEPLIAYYESKGKLTTVEGQEEVRDTTALTFAPLEKML